MRCCVMRAVLCADTWWKPCESRSKNHVSLPSTKRGGCAAGRVHCVHTTWETSPGLVCCPNRSQH